MGPIPKILPDEKSTETDAVRPENEQKKHFDDMPPPKCRFVVKAKGEKESAEIPKLDDFEVPKLLSPIRSSFHESKSSGMY
jgi:hypothetical protein